MQLKIIQIALGWRGEKYSLKVSDWMRSKLCDTVRHMHEWEELSDMSGFFLCVCVWFQGPWQLRYFMLWFPWLEGESLFFFSFLPPCLSGHWHAARQYVASQCELSCPAGWQGKATRTNWLLLVPNVAPASYLLAPFGPDHLSTCTGESSKDLTSTRVHGRRMRQLMRHGNFQCSKVVCVKYKCHSHDSVSKNKNLQICSYSQMKYLRFTISEIERNENKIKKSKRFKLSHNPHENI